MGKPEIVLAHGPTGLEARTPEGRVVGHICHTGEVEAVLDYLREQFPVPVWTWLNRNYGVEGDPWGI